MKKISWQILTLALIILVALVLRLYRIHYPLLDWHSFRQADTASVSREFVKQGVNLLRPTYHDLSSIQSGLDNSQNGYRMVEFPIINAVVAEIIYLMPFLPLVETSRFVSILFSIGTLVCLFFLTEKISGKKAAITTALTFAVLPFIVYYSRAILPEAGMLFFLTASLVCFANWLKKRSLKWYMLSALSLAIAFLLKPFVVFMAPTYLALAWFFQGKNLFKNPLIYIFPVLSIAPLLFWRDWIQKFPEGIPASEWLYNGNSIRFRPAWIRWLGYERLTKLILGFVGVIFIPFAMLDKQKDSIVYAAWWLGIITYFTVFASGNVQHDYYQILATPIIAMSIGKGAMVMRTHLERFLVKFSKVSTFYVPWISLLVISFVYLIMLGLSWNQVKGYFNVNHWEFEAAGQAVDQKTPEDAKVIAPNFGDTGFLFQTNRTGWPIGGEIDKKIKQGATHYVTTNNDEEAKKLSDKYFIIEQTDKYIIIDLTKTKAE
jgi:4-amino-4-deoxy-L-arabinose transferase-like glycosyltransferase